jgi:hypothetical protein
MPASLENADQRSSLRVHHRDDRPQSAPPKPQRTSSHSTLESDDETDARTVVLCTLLESQSRHWDTVVFLPQMEKVECMVFLVSLHPSQSTSRMALAVLVDTVHYFHGCRHGSTA